MPSFASGFFREQHEVSRLRAFKVSGPDLHTLLELDGLAFERGLPLRRRCERSGNSGDILQAAARWRVASS
jgi:hypothetical protein